MTIRSSFGRNRYVAGEDDFVAGTIRSWTDRETAGILFVHGSGYTARTVAEDPVQRNLILKCARYGTVHAGDYGFQTWGNALGIQRLGEAIAHLRAAWGSSGPVVLVAGSMGVLNALAYARAFPESVAAVAGIIPGLDIQDLYGRGAAADIDAAYGGHYDDALDGPTHSPVRFAGALPAELPIHLWTAPDDTLTVPATADAFVAARPQTGRTVLDPPQGHSLASILEATPEVVEFVKSHV